MNSNAPRRILLGVTGGIAAYKSPDLVRRLIERGAEVQVVMTRGAAQFITPLTLQAVSGRPVRTDLWDREAEAAMGHIELARWADTIVVAPATADFIARLAHGMADDLLTTLCLATDAPIRIAPAMNRLMYANPATQANLGLLHERGIEVLGPGEGEQACGEIGAGRMLEPLEIAEAVLAPNPQERVLEGFKVLVTAGPTRERIDPVRFISNRSSGKMGYAVAEAAREAGAEVVLVSGPVQLCSPPGIERVSVETAEDMLRAVESRLAGTDVFIAAAAVSDYRAAEIAAQKIKKKADELTLRLSRTPDVLASVGARDADRPFLVGFAAETEKLEEHALAKLRGKRLDMIAANQVGDNLAFDRDDNALTVYWPGGSRHLAVATKRSLAQQLVRLIAERFHATRPTSAATDPRSASGGG
ncbi:MAG TPA: bifunctional phosphopantothenoylcysteine decarboxylase/phosphopantothenate--cysteine ligase CoaBC [Steroidobacteraceae bacterium]|nr:bifunctional phosphopantothenoylcysteine decarboxylase/phosphopantothenate--cysteine ligase CoaBC [Steroidobacteraceae bacterium]